MGVQKNGILAYYTQLAAKSERGYFVSSYCIIDLYFPHLCACNRFVLPRTKRMKVVRVVNDKTGHFSPRKVKYVVNRRFALP